jgi:predicted O-methyltransferase YrrM
MQPTTMNQAGDRSPSVTPPNRTADLTHRTGNRYWWHHRDNCDFEPPIYSWLSDTEMALFKEWLVESENEFGPGTGECTVPCMSMLQALVMGNGMSRVVQLGHYIGYSTFFFGLMLKRMGNQGRLFSADIDPRATEFTQTWIERFDVADHVTLQVIDSSDPEAVAGAKAAFGGLDPQLVFIDSSHAYRHTLAELDRWHPALQTWGFIVMHDASAFAGSFDGSGDGGVHRAIEEWNLMADDRIFTINGPYGADEADVQSGGRDLAYVDGCGLGMLQKVPR